MKSKTKQEVLRFPLSLLHYGNFYYLERVAELERVLAKRPRQLQIDMTGEGEIAAEWAMLIRDILCQRSPKTRLITNSRSSLKNGSVLVWLLGDQRSIRPDAWLFFRKSNVLVEAEDEKARVWNQDDWKKSDTESDPDEIVHAQMLQLINEYLPVKELTGKVIDEATLRQFGLVDNDHFDRFLANAFGQTHSADIKRADAPKKVRAKGKAKGSVSAQK
jgi:hypothetical protein